MEILQPAIMKAEGSSIKKVGKLSKYNPFLSYQAELLQVCYLFMELRGLLEVNGCGFAALQVPVHNWVVGPARTLALWA